MTPPDRRRFVLIAGLLAVISAGVLASVATPAPHSGGDNAGYLSLAHALVSGEGYTELWDPAHPPHTKYPPIFPLLLSGLMLAGVSGWMGFKLMMAGLTSASVLLVFAWICRRTGPLFAAAVAAATMFSAGWLDTSRWILSEPSFLAFTFLTLWAADRAGLKAQGWAEAQDAKGDHRASSEIFWLALAGGAASAAVFTRASGLPLLFAVAGSLMLARRLRAFVTLGLCLILPITWWLTRTAGQGAYVSEFWMQNPYEPDLGTIGWLDLPVRAWANLELYVGTVLPMEWWGGTAGATPLFLGVPLFGLASWGWVERVRRGPGVAELFAPLYFGLILVWPEVWSGNRFLLPLYPLILLYAGSSVLRIGRRAGPTCAAITGAIAFLVLLIPALPGWLSIASEASQCRVIARSGDPLRCQGTGMIEFRDAAAWAGANLPADAVVLSRKPRVFYLFGGPSGVVFPFTRDPDRFLDEADRVGADYLLLDHIDTVSLFYLPAILSTRPLAFCHRTGWRSGGGPGTELFRILPPEERIPGGDLLELPSCVDFDPQRIEGSPAINGGRIPRIGTTAVP